jgi:hypothetical protein
LYAYVLNSPVARTDSLGLLVDAVLDVNTNLLTIRDRDSARTVTVNAFTGGMSNAGIIQRSGLIAADEFGAAPKGRYFIGREPSGEHGGDWYGLFRDDWIVNDRTSAGLFGASRTGLRLHLGWYSIGCVTVDKFQPDAAMKWSEIRWLLDHTMIEWSHGRLNFGTLTIK